MECAPGGIPKMVLRRRDTAGKEGLQASGRRESITSVDISFLSLRVLLWFLLEHPQIILKEKLSD